MDVNVRAWSGSAQRLFLVYIGAVVHWKEKRGGAWDNPGTRPRRVPVVGGNDRAPVVRAPHHDPCGSPKSPRGRRFRGPQKRSRCRRACGRGGAHVERHPSARHPQRGTGNERGTARQHRDSAAPGRNGPHGDGPRLPPAIPDGHPSFRITDPNPESWQRFEVDATHRRRHHPLRRPPVAHIRRAPDGTHVWIVPVRGR